jgi:hypothetical protein
MYANESNIAVFIIIMPVKEVCCLRAINKEN